ncbi:hypothetical protein KSF_107050 [Reticulibacter mediterranei]|uniref:Uncharacterized protein n=1 Tax=Reticulibacter mediterranei TaxID=2778369 RepID=A0A8J3N6S1_9CHLR|nr:hypothetical protein [Reticulibacter mediterranei]GHP00658.1 hypothetical protein KSF_107050 [Reticulibacter mediterranei]
MSETLEERDGWLYIKSSSARLTEPKQIANWWPLQVRFADFAQRFASLDEARKRIGRPMVYLGSGLYRDEEGLRYRLVNNGQTKPQFTDITDIPEPTQRGRKLPVEWRNGCWYKQTSRGWKRA